MFDDAGKYKGKVTAYDSPIYIADAALYLSKTKPELGIKDPYSLTPEQLDAAVELLKKQRENVSEYWSDYTKEVQAFESGTSVIGTTWQVIANTIGTDNKVQVNTVLPKEGATGWSDTWMVSAKAAHPNCMYKWMDWITSPEVNAQVAEYFGEAPAQTKACEHTSRNGLLRHLPRDRREVRRRDPLLDHPAEAVRRRQRRQLHGLHRVGRQVAADQGLTRRGAATPTASTSLGRRISLAFLLVPPMAWLVVAYLGSLAVLLVSAFWSTNAFTGAVVHTFTSDNIVRVLTDAVFRTATVRTVSVALAVTVICAVLAVPLAFYMAKVASPRVRLALVVAVTTPLWASYLVKAYAWRMLLSPEGPMSWATGYTPGLRADRHRRHADVSVVALHGHPGVRGVRTRPGFADRRQLRPGRLRLRDAANGGRAVGVPRHRGRLDLHVLAVARRLHRGDDRRRQDPDARQHHLRPTRHRQQPAAGRGAVDHPAGWRSSLYLLAMRRTGALENV